MAEAIVSSDTLSCPICWNLLKCPETIVCGHSYCMDCISRALDGEAQKGIYSCPECRQTFASRPVIAKNVMLADVIMMLNQSVFEDTPSLSTQQRHLNCFDCTGNEPKATVSCLACCVSFCESHYALHEIQHSRQGLRCLHTSICMKIAEKNNDLQTLVKDVAYMKGSAQATIEHSERIFTELIGSLHKMPSELVRLIRNKEKTELNHAERCVKQLQEEIVDLTRRADELEKFSQTENTFYASPNLQPLCGSSESQINPNRSFRNVRLMISEMKQKILDICNDEVENITSKLAQIQIITLEPTIRKEFLKYFHPLTLVINTVNLSLRITKVNTKVENVNLILPYPDHPDRFDFAFQVLCEDAVSGQSYWEAKWSGLNGVIVAVCYKSINRKSDGYRSIFGHNYQSWRLRCTPFICSFKHSNKEVQFPPVPSSSRVGVYVDYRVGTLSFYQVSDTMTLIHRVHTVFTELLYPGFGIHPGSSVKICNSVL